MQEESLQTGSQRGLTRTFLTEQVQDAKMPGLPVHNVTEEGCKQITKGYPDIVAENCGQLFYIVVEQGSALVGMHHQTFELEDFRVVAVNLRCGRNVVGIVLVVGDDAHVIHFMELAVLNNAVTEGEELLAFVPAQLADALPLMMHYGIVGALLACLVIARYDGTRGFIHGKVAKYGFYAFYPLHLLCLVGYIVLFP